MRFLLEKNIQANKNQYYFGFASAGLMFKINYTVNEEIKRIPILRLPIAKNKFAQ